MRAVAVEISYKESPNSYQVSSNSCTFFCRHDISKFPRLYSPRNTNGSETRWQRIDGMPPFIDYNVEPRAVLWLLQNSFRKYFMVNVDTRVICGVSLSIGECDLDEYSQEENAKDQGKINCVIEWYSMNLR